MMVAVADTVMIGRLGEVPLAASTLAHSVFIIMFMFAVGFSYGLTPLVASFDSADEQKKAAEYLKNSLLLFLGVSVVMSVLLIGFRPFMQVLQSPKDVTQLAKGYLFWIALSIVPFMFFQVFKQFAEGLADTKMAMAVIIVSNLLNILGNYLLIFGKWGLPEMGLNGAALATFLSRVVMALVMLIYFLRSERFRIYRAYFRSCSFKKTVIRRLSQMGFPIALQYLFEVGAFSIAVIMIGWIGARDLAAHQIAINLASLTYMSATGIASAATVRVGNQLGLRDWNQLKRVASISYSMVIIFMGLTAMLFVVFNQQLPWLYIQDTDVIKITSGLILIAAIFQLADGVQVTGLGILRGMQDVKVPTIIAMTSYWLIGLPVSYLLGFGLNQGVYGVWYGLCAGLFTAAILLYFRYRKLISRKMKV